MPIDKQTDHNMIYFKNDKIIITYDENLKLVRTQWQDFVNSEEYRQILDIYLQLVTEHPVTRWIGDNTNAKAIRPADQEWTAREWAPEFSRRGQVKRMAVIVATDIFNKMAVENMLMKGGGGVAFDTHFFENETKALAWVMEV
ncbi:STAS/SEC14 domain-containing protein [Rufibacter glacialis]|uniref:STAS/SEC14 domain-containing protein n=1 Tax=Rufibacter glacialis TaxID=1259555 RepID=A0A5M8QK41_9BACT|nr:STAS/SEC14 domain-containing protein [Rufibacter glacialis]KAA6434672.1 hypothetical protein FOE74_10860 [Rufibacter glacialis]GGK71499.1 hypothetical protein GCM10011405_19610 [Rufibacter glacialis]